MDNLEKAREVLKGIRVEDDTVNENAKTGEAAQSHSGTKRKVWGGWLSIDQRNLLTGKRRAVLMLTAPSCPGPTKASEEEISRCCR